MIEPLARKIDLLSEEVSGERVIYDIRRKKAHQLNSTLTWIWNSCDGHTSVERMTEGFEHRFGVANSRDILIEGLKQLESCELLDVPTELPDVQASEPSMTRRSVMASAILMPAVVSIIAPTPADAKSKPDTGDGNDQGNGNGKD